MARLFRVRLLTALLLALPLQIAIVVFCLHVNARFTAFDNYADKQQGPLAVSGGTMPPFDLEQWRWLARDARDRLVAATFAPRPPADSALETFHLSIAGRKIDDLDSDLPESGKSDTKKSLLLTGGDALKVKARYVGDNHWHWLYTQKSWRIKLRKDKVWRGRRVFTLKNPPGLTTVDEPVGCDLATELAVLTPEVRPVRMFLNGKWMGVYRFMDVADESLLRRNRRMPGSIYSGDGAPADPVTGVSTLFDNHIHWKKDASRNAERSGDRSDIIALLAAVNSDDPATFAAWAARNLDIDTFARYHAIDRAVAGIHHDFNHNHKLYVDPYRGRFEPILWDLSAWMLGVDDDRLDLSLNPLLMAMRRVPTIEHRMLEVLRDELDGTLHADRILARVDHWNTVTRPSLVADGNRDRTDHNAAWLGFPIIDSTHFSIREYDEVLAALPDKLRHRHERLRARFDDCQVQVHEQRGGDHIELQFSSSGHTAADWTALRITTDSIAAGGSVELLADRNRNGRLDEADPVIAQATTTDDRALVLEFAERLYPGLHEIPALRGSAILLGRVEFVATPLHYRYFVRGLAENAAPDALGMTVINALTGDRVEPQIRPEPPAQATNESSAERISCHPWRLPAPSPPETVALGPGKVRIDETRTFAPNVTLRIRAGTDIAMGEGASLLCRGPVFIEGTKEQPVRVRAAAPEQSWGCFSLHGAATAGSRISHARFEGGHNVDRELLQMTGMVDISVTRDIELEDCWFGPNASGDDSLHFAYVEASRVSTCTFERTLSDGFDLDLCRDVTIADSRFATTGNDGLDLMTCDITVQNCRFENCGDKGISVGEDSTLSLLGCTMSGCAIGVQIKDQSRVTADRLELHGCPIGVSFLHKNPRYASRGSLAANSLHFAGVQTPIQSHKGFAHECKAMFLDGQRWTP